jgi:hypothetical protein
MPTVAARSFRSAHQRVRLRQSPSPCEDDRTGFTALRVRLITIGAHLAPIAVATLLYFLSGPSYVWRPADHLPDAADSVLNTWILEWNAHAFPRLNQNVWNAPILFPTENALAFSEAMFGNLWVTGPVQFLTGNPVLAANALLFVSMVLGTYTTFLLVRHLTGGFLAGMVAGVLFSFNPFRWAEAHHLQLMPFFWTPLTLLYILQFLDKRGLRHLMAASLGIVVQTYSSIYLGILLAALVAVFVPLYLRFSQRLDRSNPALWKDKRIYMAALVGMLLLAPLGVPYVQAAHAWRFSRSESENVSFSAEPLSFFVCSDRFASHTGWMSGWKIRGAYGLGVLPWLLAGVGLALGRRSPNPVRKAFAWTAVAVAVLMLGPYLIWFDVKTRMPLPYLFFYHAFPGAQAIRVPARFIFPLLLCLAVLGGYGVSYMLSRVRAYSPVIRGGWTIGFLALFAFDYAVADDPGAFVERRRDFPPVYEYLSSTNPGEPVLELPAATRRQFRYMHYQTLHRRPLIGGETGCYTPASLALTERTSGLPTDPTGRFLAATPARTIVIHLDQIEPRSRDAWRELDLRPFGFESVGLFGHAHVWERRIAAPPLATRLRIVAAEFDRYPGRWRENGRLKLTVVGDPPDAVWRHLAPPYGPIELSFENAAGAVCRMRQDVQLPAYLLPGEHATLIADKLQGVPEAARNMRIQADFVCEPNHPIPIQGKNPCE